MAEQDAGPSVAAKLAENNIRALLADVRRSCIEAIFSKRNVLSPNALQKIAHIDSCI
jgi:hypothetical protein